MRRSRRRSRGPRDVSGASFAPHRRLPVRVREIMKSDGTTVVHLHAAFADPKGRVLGGHLLEGGGAVAVTAEVVIDALDGVSLTRAVDGETDMPIFSLGD